MRRRADETRRRVLDAVYDQLRAAPARPVSVDRIARTAGVARSTVYVIFGSRAGLFDAFAADLLERGGFSRVLDAIADPDPRVTSAEESPAACTPSPPTVTSIAPSSRWRRSTRMPSAARCSAASSDEPRG